ncbi:MAG: helix-turn-helix domain-containing protein [Oscillospiraceae bacterium]|nr:helix-turn-helix domain-containing protein [Oscillospiraceae bacterium]
MAYYQRIRDLREDSDATQQKLAEYLGTSSQHYGKYENGNAEIPFERAIMLAEYYGVSLDYIAGLTNNKKGLAASSLTDEQQELLNFLSGLSDSERKFLRKLMEHLGNTVK